MTRSEFSAAFRAVFSAPAFAPYLAAEEKFFALTALLLAENEKTNLTAITDPAAIILLHYADSVTAAPFLPCGASVIDVGCGGGFPTLPLAIVRPDLHITALDSTAKKLQFVSDAASALSLSGVTVLAARAEEIGQDPRRRESYDAAVSRAVARMNVLCELCLPLVKTGGRFVALKGAAAAQEVKEAAAGISRLGGKLLSLSPAELGDPSLAASHQIAVIEKSAQTPKIYPRNYAQIVKKPL